MSIRDRIRSLFRNDAASAPALQYGGYDQPGIGLGCLAERVRTASFSSGRQLRYFEVESLLRYSAIARRVCYVQAEDAVKGGATVVGATAEQNQDIAAELDRIGWWDHAVTGRAWARAYGGAITVLDIDDGREWHEPVDYNGIEKVCGAMTIDREDVVTVEWPQLKPGQLPINVEPRTLHVQIRQGPYTRTMPVHRTRCVVWHGLPSSQRETGEDDWWWGTSFLELVDAQLTRYGAAHQLAAEVLASTTQEVLSSPAVRDAIAQSGGPQAIRDRARSLKYGMGVLSMMVLDESESYDIKTRGAPGFAEIMEALRGELVAATGIPRIKLYGEQPGGLGEQGMPGELRVWYDQVETERPDLLGGPTRYAIRLLTNAKDTPVRLDPGPIQLEWEPLVTPTPDEILANRKAAAEARRVDIDSGIVTEDEARHDPDVLEHYPEIDIEEPAPGKPEGGGGLFGDAPQQDADAVTLPDPTNPWQPEPGEELIGLGAAAAHLGIGPGAMRRLIAEGSIRAGKIGSRWRVSKNDVRKVQRGILGAGE